MPHSLLTGERAILSTPMLLLAIGSRYWPAGSPFTLTTFRFLIAIAAHNLPINSRPFRGNSFGNGRSAALYPVISYRIPVI